MEVKEAQRNEETKNFTRLLFSLPLVPHAYFHFFFSFIDV